jgi:hypothetical protein
MYRIIPIDADDDAAERVCREHAAEHGFSANEADACDDGDVGCPHCPFAPDEPSEPDDSFADGEALASAGWGTDEDYGCYGGDEF